MAINIFEIFSYGFMVRAFVAGALIAVIAPIIGNFLVIRRFSLIADTLSHVALAGVALGLILGTHPLATAAVFTVISSVAIERLRSGNNFPGDAVLAMFLPGGLALSVVLLSLTNGFNVNLFSYLFGSITTIRPDELWLIIGLGIATVVTVVFSYKELLYASFDAESAQVSGIPVKRINLILVVLTAITVSLAMRTVGALLIGALMIIPVVTSMQIGKSFRQTVYLSVVFALIAVIVGLFLAYYLNLPAGAAIVLLSLALFTAVVLLKK